MKPNDDTLLLLVFNRPNKPARKDLSAENTYCASKDLFVIFPASKILF